MNFLSKRRQVNGSIKTNVDNFVDIAQRVIKSTRVINRANYDLRDLTTKKSVEFLEITVESTQIVKKNWILLRKSINSVIFCLDWYINRCNMDLKRYREKLNGETQIIPRDEFDLPDWEG